VCGRGWGTWALLGVSGAGRDRRERDGEGCDEPPAREPVRSGPRRPAARPGRAPRRRGAAQRGRFHPAAAGAGHRVLLGCGVDATGSAPQDAQPAMKALNNLVSAAGLLAAAEALVVGRRFGLDPSRMLDVLNPSTGRDY